MNDEERDELLIRVDQKIQDSLPNIERRLENLNGKVRGNEVRSKINQGAGALILTVFGWLSKHLGLW